VPGLIARDTGIAAATQGVASVQVVRKGQGETATTRHDADILFGYVMSGSAVLQGDGQPDHPLADGDAVVIPPGMATRLADVAPGFELLEVALPGRFATHPA
jgi:quercetin dioxygenase-like cupin family protein